METTAVHVYGGWRIKTGCKESQIQRIFKSKNKGKRKGRRQRKRRKKGNTEQGKEKGYEVERGLA